MKKKKKKKVINHRFLLVAKIGLRVELEVKKMLVYKIMSWEKMITTATAITVTVVVVTVTTTTISTIRNNNHVKVIMENEDDMLDAILSDMEDRTLPLIGHYSAAEYTEDEDYSS